MTQQKSTSSIQKQEQRLIKLCIVVAAIMLLALARMVMKWLM
ncbi:hypothetical protein [Paenibacillus selenitireducens]|nr:hypothetical protein [Paenibacillus selenitireducens]